MYLNQTAMLCLSPHIPGSADQYTSHTVKVAVALNGQDFLEDTSNAAVTFVGTGRSFAIIYYLFTAILLSLFVISLIMICVAVLGYN